MEVPKKTEDPEKLLTDKQIRRAVHRNSFPNWKDILSIIGVFFVSSLLMTFVVLMAGGGTSGFSLFLTYVGQFGITIAYTIFLIKQRTKTLQNVMSFSFRGFNPAVILWGLILMLAVNVVIEPLIDLFPAEWYDLVGDQIKEGGWAMVTAVVAAPILEEWLFRGLIQDSLVRKNGPWKGILLASLIFGIIHLIPQQVITGILLGTIIGFVYYKTRSLLSAIVLHGINNSLAVFLSLLETEENPMGSLREAIGSDTTYCVIFGVSVLLLILSLVQVVGMIRRGKERNATVEAVKASENQ